MKRSISEMTTEELKIERQKMVDTIDRLANTQDGIGRYQLNCATILRFAIDCQIRARQPAPAPLSAKVYDMAQFKARRVAQTA